MGRWTEVQLGETIGPLAFALADLDERYRNGSRNALPLHDTWCDPTIAGNLAIRVLGSKYPGPIIHSHQDLEFLAPVRADAIVTAVGTVALKQMRRDKAYVAIDCVFEAEGSPVWRAKMTCIWPEVHLRGEV